MGDRTTCYLDIGGAIPRSLANRIMSGELDWPCTAETTPPTNGDVDGGCWTVVFHEVNYAQIDDNLEAALIAAKVPWCWRWQAGGGYGEGARWWVPGKTSPSQTTLAEGDEVVAIGTIQRLEAEQPGLLVSELLEKLAPMPDVPPATFVEDVPTIRLGPDPDPETFTVICEGHIHSVVEAVDAKQARQLAEQRGWKVAGIVKGRAIVLGA